MRFAPTAFDADGVVQLITGASANGYVSGQGYDSDGKAMAKTGSVAATDASIGGFLYSKDAELRILDATAGLPAYYTMQQGVALDISQRLCVTTDPFNASDAAYVAGLAVTLDGRAYAVVS